VVGGTSVTLTAKAKARVGFPSQAMYVAPIAVKDTHPLIHGTGGCPSIGFHMTDYDARGSNGSITGYFTEYIAQGILSTSGGGDPSFGVRATQLIE
jgi:hypothetical protein